jgi:hypothetical protein
MAVDLEGKLPMFILTTLLMTLVYDPVTAVFPEAIASVYLISTLSFTSITVSKACFFPS